MKFIKFIIALFLIFSDSTIACKMFSTEQLENLKFKDPEGNEVKGSQILAPEILFKNQKDAEENGITFDWIYKGVRQGKPPREGQLILVPRAGGGYSFAVINEILGGVYFVQNINMAKNVISEVGTCDRCSFKKILAKKVEKEEKKKKEEEYKES